MRAYTLDELEDLRRAVEQIWLFGTTEFVPGFSRQFRGAEKDVAVEAQVRTYMLAGITADDLRARYEPPVPSGDESPTVTEEKQ